MNQLRLIESQGIAGAALVGNLIGGQCLLHLHLTVDSMLLNFLSSTTTVSILNCYRGKDESRGTDHAEPQ